MKRSVPLGDRQILTYRNYIMCSGLQANRFSPVQRTQRNTLLEQTKKSDCWWCTTLITYVDGRACSLDMANPVLYIAVHPDTLYLGSPLVILLFPTDSCDIPMAATLLQLSVLCNSKDVINFLMQYNKYYNRTTF